MNQKMVPKHVSSLSLLVICVCLFGTVNFAYGQDSSEDTYVDETSYGNGDSNIVVDAEDPLPTLPYDGVQMTKDIADLKDLVASLKNQVIQNTGDLASTIVQNLRNLI
jgi:hypothetical protein